MLDTCIHCGADMRGEPIPEEHRESYGNSTHFKREFALYDRDRDRTYAFQCPDCGGKWDRDGKPIVVKIRDLGTV